MGAENLHGVSVSVVGEINSAEHDAVVLVLAPGVPTLQALEDFVDAAIHVDRGLEQHCAVLSCPRVSGGRLVLSPTGPLTPYDDVRSLSEAARAGVRRAAAAGARRPALALTPCPLWPRATLVAVLGALEALYVPLQIRESFPAQAHRLQALGVYGEGLKESLPEVLREAIALEHARGVARDIGGADPERMTPRAAAAYVRAAFGPAVRVDVKDDPAFLAREYPLFAAVDRCAAKVERHRGCVIFLEYEPKNYEQTVMLVGKGVTYDTGGCDIKAGGAMAGMSRDKCGAAAVAGFLKGVTYDTGGCDIKAGGAMAGMSRDKCGAAAVAGFLKACELLQPEIKVCAALCMVRNSVGSEAYVADELIRSRRGLAVRVGNTDAEGRMVMADLLDEMHERALKEKRPHLYTVATLTGHAVRAYGEGYSAVMDNHVARTKGHAEAFRAAAEALGDMVEVSTVRREDLAAHRGQAAGDQLHQAASLPSSALPRGHQGPAAFLLLASGLAAGGVPYSHLDVAAAAGSFPAPPTAAPLLALAAHYKLIRTQ